MSRSLVVISACICVAFGGVVKEIRDSVEVAPAEVNPEDGQKAWGRPPYLTPPGIPAIFGNASQSGNVGTLFAVNNSTLTAISGPEQTAMASLNSQASYYAVPINETQSGWDGITTNNQNLAGFTVTAVEDTNAYAEGEWIQFVNHGGSYATGFGESDASGGTYNPGPASPGWKSPASEKVENAGKKE